MVTVNLAQQPARWTQPTLAVTADAAGDLTGPTRIQLQQYVDTTVIPAATIRAVGLPGGLTLDANGDVTGNLLNMTCGDVTVDFTVECYNTVGSDQLDVTVTVPADSPTGTEMAVSC